MARTKKLVYRFNSDSRQIMIFKYDDDGTFVGVAINEGRRRAVMESKSPYSLLKALINRGEVRGAR